MKKIAILGATSHVAKNLIVSLLDRGDSIILYARNCEQLKRWLSSQLVKGHSIPECYEIGSFPVHGDYDGIINCVGFGTPDKLKGLGFELFQVTEHWDNKAIQYLTGNPQCVYVNFSSGAVYGTDHSSPIDENSQFIMPLGYIDAKDFYRIAKIASEAKHRACEGFNIWDIRLFNFFSRHIEIESSYLITEMLRAVRDNVVFVTGVSDLIRDYIDPRDLASLVYSCLSTPEHNSSVDSRSKASISKLDLISLFIDEFDLQVTYVDGGIQGSPTGLKTMYCSNNKTKDSILGWTPKFSSQDAICEEARALVNSWKN